MAEDRTLFGSRRRKPFLIGIVAVLLAVGAGIVLSQRDAHEAPGEGASGEGAPIARGAGVAQPTTPSFRFETEKSRVLVPTTAGHLEKREKNAGERAAEAAKALLTDLYTEAFLDPANWQAGRYSDAYRFFAADASVRARAEEAVLTAGPSAGDLYEQILPVSGRLATRILLDRAGKPTVIVSAVTFTARALGPEPTRIRSEGQFFIQRVGRLWRVVSFQVTRNDREAA